MPYQAELAMAVGAMIFRTHYFFSSLRLERLEVTTQSRPSNTVNWNFLDETKLFWTKRRLPSHNYGLSYGLVRD
jgi:hypothetical protein